MNTLSEQITKLPKWAQEHIKNLTRQRDVAVRALDKYVNKQTESSFYTEDLECTGEQSGPTCRKRYIQTHSIFVVWQGVKLQIDAHDYGNVGSGIYLRWSADDRISNDIAFIPASYQSARLVNKAFMR